MRRFTQRDPIGIEGGINLYAYVDSSPINLTDPLGLLPKDPQPGRGSQSSYHSGCLSRAPTTQDATLVDAGEHDGIDFSEGAVKVADVFACTIFDQDYTQTLKAPPDPREGNLQFELSRSLPNDLATLAPLPVKTLGALGKLLGVIGVEAKVAESAAAKEAGVVANGIRGRASEVRVLNELGLTKNTTAVSTAEGRSIPEALTKSLSVEVKDAAHVNLTRQLRIQTEGARASGRESVLIKGENTCVSGACSRAFDTIIRRLDLGPR